jgi:hypothetical protein
MPRGRKRRRTTARGRGGRTGRLRKQLQIKEMARPLLQPRATKTLRLMMNWLEKTRKLKKR